MPDANKTLLKNLTDYFEVKAERLKLKIASRLATLFSSMLSIVFILMVSFFFLFFISFAAGYWLNEIFKSSYLGFLMVAGFYLIIIALILVFFRIRTIQNLFESILIKVTAPEEDEEDD